MIITLIPVHWVIDLIFRHISYIVIQIFTTIFLDKNTKQVSVLIPNSPGTYTFVPVFGQLPQNVSSMMKASTHFNSFKLYALSLF